MGKNGFRIIHLNVRSFFNKRDELYLMYNGYDIVCFTETWLSSLIPDKLLAWPGYKLFRKDRYESIDIDIPCKKGGGILIHVNNKFSKYSEELCLQTEVNSDIELLSFTLKYPNMRKQQITAVYLPPTGNINKFVMRLKDLLEDISLIKVDVVILGDFNINYNQRQVEDFTY